jgi:hypothetical protein
MIHRSPVRAWRVLVVATITAVAAALTGATSAVAAPAFLTMSTSPFPSSVTLPTPPQPLMDSAFLSGGASPTGTITFTLLSPTGPTVDTETVTVNGNGSYTTPVGFTLPTNGTVTGTYQWNAVYSGDANNAGVSELDDPSERVTVSPASPSIVTTPASPVVTLGSSPPILKDSASLSDGYAPTGTITFTLLSPTSTTVDTETVTVNGTGTYTTPTGFTFPTTGALPGIYQWNASYTPDANNSSAFDFFDPNERVDVGQALTSIATTAGTGVTLGTAAPTLTDSAVLSGGYFPTGTIDFTLFGPGGSLYTQSVTVSGNGTYTAAIPLFTFGTVAGPYHWSATYNGDANNVSAFGTNNDPAEQATVSPNPSPSIATTPSTTTASPGATMKDSAVLSGGYFPTGSILFTLLDPNGHVVDSETVPVNNGNDTYTTPSGYFLSAGSPPVVPPSPLGTYQWNALYSGDTNNNQTSEVSNASEQVVVKNAPSLATTPSATSVTLGTASPTLTDSAVLSGGVSPTGTLTFTLVGPANVTVDTETVTVNGAGTYTTPVGFSLPTTGAVAGTYQWNAAYTGDSSNFPASDNNAPSERVTVSQANPAVVTTPNPTTATTGGVLNDTATVSGGYFPTGTLTFTLTSPTNAVVDTESVAVNGNGAYSTPIGYVPTAPGTFQWVATYSGDANNTGFASTVGAEPVTAQGTTCTQVLSGQQVGNLRVGSGIVCLVNARVTGSVIVGPGGQLVVSLSSVGGSLSASRAMAVTMCGSTVHGRVVVSGTTKFVLLGDPGDDGCPGNQFGAGVTLSANHGAVEVDQNTITGNLIVKKTTGTGPYPEDQGAEIGGNTIHSGLSCPGNSPISNDGAANSVTGTRTGQCKTPGFI